MFLPRLSKASRGIAHAAVRRASVSDAKVINKPLEKAGAAAAAAAHLTSQEASAAVRREEKLQKYGEALRKKATKQGFSSVEDLIEKQKAKKGDPSPPQKLTQKDAEVAQAIFKRAEAVAERKHQSNNFSSGPGGGMKSLSDIIDVERVREDDADKIAQLWTQYHTLKNKLSAVIPAEQYAAMVNKAKRYPQFILPLPRTIVGSEDANKTANVAPGERKSGYEMQYMEWGFFSTNSSETSTVLFTPLAEYKLRQEYAQPVLVLTHFTDLAVSKGIVLLRGELSDVSDGQASISKTAHAPLQSQGPITPQDAQLLTVTLQRFYLPKAAGVGEQPGEREREELLEAFHGDQDRFDIDKLCKCAFDV